MVLINHFYASVLLLLGFLCPLSHPFPMKVQGQMAEQCTSYARMLLQNITDTLSQRPLFGGVECEKPRVELHLNTNTTSACAPKGLLCSGLVMSGFNQESCLRNIREDLRHYYKLLTGYFHPESSLHTLLLSLRELMETAPAHLRSYGDRLRLCKVLSGFRVRTITINRAIAYMSSGEHMQ
ncbi:interleukin-12 subunit alpha [Nelusetta ayraudi]|uniref:interleukin-12 subunit alpha n=1 Tax=Nelusetta ayraudi TaxID=303726 RepID=UPI003F7205AE